MTQTIVVKLSDKNFQFLENRMTMVGVSRILDNTVNAYISGMAEMYYLQKRFDEHIENEIDENMMEEPQQANCSG